MKAFSTIEKSSFGCATLAAFRTSAIPEPSTGRVKILGRRFRSVASVPPPAVSDISSF